MAENRKKMTNFAEHKARMAELADALVSNTSGAIHLGSSPSPGTDTGNMVELRQPYCLSL